MNQQAPRDRRPYLTEPGDPLLLPGSPIEHSLVYTRYQHHTGVPHEDMHTSTLVAVPIPLPPVDGFTEGRRWPNTRAEMMWHPLMWLPDWVTARYEVDGRVESADEFSVRVAIQLSECGLYDPVTGTWTDVLAEAGIDIDDPADLERVRQWLAGGEDSLLDNVTDVISEVMDMAPVASEAAAEHLGVPMEDLEALVLGYDELHAHRLARETLPILREASWALTAEELLDALDDMADGDVVEGANPTDDDAADYAWNPGARRDLTVAFVQLAREFLAGSEEVSRLDEVEQQLGAFHGDEHELFTGPVAALRELLEEVRHHYQATLDALAKGVEEGQQAVAEEPEPVI